jgi:hypothetical protein
LVDHLRSTGGNLEGHHGPTGGTAIANRRKGKQYSPSFAAPQRKWRGGHGSRFQILVDAIDRGGEQGATARI